MRQADTDGRTERTSLAGEALPTIEQIPAAIALFDDDLCCLMTNAAWRREISFTSGNPVGRDFDAAFPPSCHRLRLGLLRALAGETVICEPARALSAEGSAFGLHARAAPWRNSCGTIQGAILTCEVAPDEIAQPLPPRAEAEDSPISADANEALELFPNGLGEITRDATHAELQARSLEANAMLLRSILETMPEALVVIDINGEILLFSKAAEAMFGFAASEVIGRNVSMLMPAVEREQHSAHMIRYRNTGQSGMIGRSRRLIGRRKDGSEFPHSLQIAEAFGGGQRMIAGFMQDLSASEASALQVEQLQRELAHIGRVHEMGTLASTIAHELNQPLMAVANIVQTTAELLKQGNPAVSPAIAKALDEAGHETLRAGDILRRLRDFLSRGELDKTLEDARKLAQDSIAFEAASARYRNIRCMIDCTPGIPPILVDRVQIQQVILNLVKNAVHSIGKDGTVRITIAPQPDKVRFIVSDTGHGVPPERVARLFAPFSTTKTEGMGLGLPICRSIIEAHGGRIWHEAAPEGGAAFIFTLPLFQEERDNAQ